jgi:hypothetical protein
MRVRMIEIMQPAAFAFFVLLAALYPTQAQQPSLSETLAWIESTYNDNSAQGGSPGYGLIEFWKDDKLTSRRHDSFSYNRCIVTVHHDVVSEFSSLGFTTYDSTIDLTMIDPTSIKVILYQKIENYIVMPTCDLPNEVCDAAAVEFETIGRKPVIIDKFEKHTQSDSKSGLIADNPEYAPRLAKALRNAVELCGGKPSAF